MAKSKSKTEEKLLTEGELELMTILWKIGEGAVSDVIAELPKGRDLAYTSVSTILRILEQKGFLEARKEGRGHTYVPLVVKDEYEARTVKHVIHRVFDNTPAALVKQLVSSVPLSAAELAELKSIIAAAEKKR